MLAQTKVSGKVTKIKTLKDARSRKKKGGKNIEIESQSARKRGERSETSAGESHSPFVGKISEGRERNGRGKGLGTLSSAGTPQKSGKRISDPER